MCRELVELVSDYLDDELPAARRSEVEAHLAECPACVDVLEQFRVVKAEVGRVREADVDRLDEVTRRALTDAFRAARRPRA